MNTQKKPSLVVTHVFPPIPDRRYDWCAYRDGDEEHGPYGWGRTPAIAIADLEELESDKEEPHHG